MLDISHSHGGHTVQEISIGLAIGAVIVLAIWRGLRASRLATLLREEREAAAAATLAAAQAEAEQKATDKKASRAAAKAEAHRVIEAEAARVRALRAARNEKAERIAHEAAMRAKGEASEESAELAARQALEHAARPAAPSVESASQELGADQDDAIESTAAAATLAVAKTPAETLILVVDDSKVVRMKTGRLLSQHGYRVVYGVDGVDGLNQVEAEMPDLVVTDIEMPNMDGFGLFRQLRGNARTAHLPVVMISSADATFRESALREGVSLVLGKPFPDEPLLEHIRSFRFAATTAATAPVEVPSAARRGFSNTEAGALA
jgi:chemosensory pili system protein ChpA (sensor histidine kinase/response regulator)